MGRLLRPREPWLRRERKRPTRRREPIAVEDGRASAWFPAPFSLAVRGKRNLTAVAESAAIEGDGNAKSLWIGGNFGGGGGDLGRRRHRTEQPESRKCRAAFPIHGKQSAAALCDARDRAAFHEGARSRFGQAAIAARVHGEPLRSE